MGLVVVFSNQWWCLWDEEEEEREWTEVSEGLKGE